MPNSQYPPPHTTPLFATFTYDWECVLKQITTFSCPLSTQMQCTTHTVTHHHCYVRTRIHAAALVPSSLVWACSARTHINPFLLTLSRAGISPPFKPRVVEGELDTGNFDKHFTNLPLKSSHGMSSEGHTVSSGNGEEGRGRSEDFEHFSYSGPLDG
mmetsp:Transcript_4088/g.7974  ORF Transcript_4088/g.7974 Transcript_4088/m.7974 type:complete len:157 (+) Transcript_4088:1853-2323(+)